MEPEFKYDDKCVSTHKLALVVREDLPVTFGKMASQCAHAAIAAHRRSDPDDSKGWYESCELTVVLAARDCNVLFSVYQTAAAENVPVYAWFDAGRTQCAPNTLTVVAVGPAKKEAVDSVCRGLHLYK